MVEMADESNSYPLAAFKIEIGYCVFLTVPVACGFKARGIGKCSSHDITYSLMHFLPLQIKDDYVMSSGFGGWNRLLRISDSAPHMLFQCGRHRLPP